MLIKMKDQNKEPGFGEKDIALTNDKVNRSEALKNQFMKQMDMEAKKKNKDLAE